MAQADEAGTYSADALALLLTAARPLVRAPSPLQLVRVPLQREVDRSPSPDEAWAQIDEALPEVSR